MISAPTSDIQPRRLKKLAQSKIPASELRSEIEKLLERERAAKAPPGNGYNDPILPLFSRCKAHLNLV
jgi:hypothetical protein